MMAIFATACVEGVEGDEGIDGIEDVDGIEGVEGIDDANLRGAADQPAKPDPDALRSPQSLQRNDDPDEGGQNKLKAIGVARLVTR